MMVKGICPYCGSESLFNKKEIKPLSKKEKAETKKLKQYVENLRKEYRKIFFGLKQTRRFSDKNLDGLIASLNRFGKVKCICGNDFFIAEKP